MKKILGVVSIATLLIGCGPAELPEIAEIKPNESAYVVPLEGATKENQGKFDSADFLEKHKVASKRIYLPLTKKKTGRLWFEYEWIPTVRVIKVDRAPVTFVWQKSGDEDDGIDVESKDSIGFTVGINISAYVLEDDTSTFLYHYPSGHLSSVLNAIVKSKATEILSREFAKYNLEGTAAVYDKNGNLIQEAVLGARQQKGTIVNIAKNELIEFFKKSGVTISTFGLIGGLAYDDKAIQEAINENFASALKIKDKENERLAQEEVNKKNVDQAVAEKQAAQEFAKAKEARTMQVRLEIEMLKAKAELVKAEKWSGNLPASIMPDGAGFIVDTTKK